jgi:cold shock CspA family protein/ribosome-associated translation inhibitor RaiA
MGERAMDFPVEISLRRVSDRKMVERIVLRKVAQLARFVPRINACRVIVEAPHARHVTGSLFHVRVELRVPGHEIVVRRDPARHQAHQDLYVAIRDAFHSARRRLEDYVREKRGSTKAHAVPPHGKVLSFNPVEGYGFIQTPDGREVYFHRNSVVEGNTHKLRVGTPVRFTEEAGREGPQASTVHVEGAHHHAVG